MTRFPDLSYSFLSIAINVFNQRRCVVRLDNVAFAIFFYLVTKMDFNLEVGWVVAMTLTGTVKATVSACLPGKSKKVPCRLLNGVVLI